MKSFYTHALEYLLQDDELTATYRMENGEEKSNRARKCLLVFAGILKSARRINLVPGLAPLCCGASHGSAMNFGMRLYPFEKAMRLSDWPTALGELWGVVRLLPLNHPMVYNTLCRVFNKSLGIHLPTKEPLRLWKKRIRDYEASSFLSGMKDAVHCIRQQTQHDEEKNAAVDYIVEVVKEAYRANFREYAMATLWKKEKTRKDFSPFPWRHLVHGEYHLYDGEPLSVNKCCLTFSIHDRKKSLPAYLDILKHGFDPEKDLCVSIYYPEAGICDIVGGYHHTTMASLLRTGEITPTSECRLSQFFSYVETDGVYWIDIESGTQMYRVADYRAATIYELLRMKHYGSYTDRN